MPSSRWARALTAVLAVLLLAGAWVAVRGWQARNGLLAARATLVGAVDLSAAGDSALPVRLARASHELERARSAVDDPVWRLAARTPWVGRSLVAVRAATLSAQDVVDGAAPPALRGLEAVRGGHLLTDGRVDLALLGSVADDLDEAGVAVDRARARRLPAGLPGPVSRPCGQLQAQVRRLADGVTAARTALRVAPGMLGSNGPRRWFVAVQNNAEARGTGGLVGAYAVVRTDQGQLTLEAVGTNADFDTAPAPVVDLGAEYAERYDRLAGRRLWSSAVLTPDWPSASQVMAGLWAVQGGGRVDGVLGVDPFAMAELLRVTGPASAGGRQIDAGNVVDFVLRDEYAQFSDASTERKDALSSLARGLYEQVAAGGWSAPEMLTALGRAGGSGHLQLWSADAGEQAVLAPLRVSGSLGSGPGAYLQVVDVNASGNKSDYYLRRQVTYRRTGPGQAEATVRLTNTVRAAAVPGIVIGRLDRPTGPVEPGQTRVQVSIYVGLGDAVHRVLVDGVEVPADMGTERGHGVGTVLVEVRPSRPTVVTAEVTDQGGPLTYRQQPLVVDDELDLQVPARVG